VPRLPELRRHQRLLLTVAEAESVQISTGDLDRPYDEIGPIKARVTAKTIFSPNRTEADVNAKLQRVAAERGADAVINVTYSRGISFTSWKALTAMGTAVKTKGGTAAPPSS
jgi:hypothetical protein